MHIQIEPLPVDARLIADEELTRFRWVVDVRSSDDKCVALGDTGGVFLPAEDTRALPEAYVVPSPARIGDVLLVQEKWKLTLLGNCTVVVYRAGGGHCDEQIGDGYLYVCVRLIPNDEFERFLGAPGWQPAHLMPPWACRSWLKVASCDLLRLNQSIDGDRTFSPEQWGRTCPPSRRQDSNPWVWQVDAMLIHEDVNNRQWLPEG